MDFRVETSVYKAFGLTIASDFKLPELCFTEMGDVLADVVIIKADLTELWHDLQEPGQSFVVKANFLMFYVPGTAIYLIREGQEIFVSPMVESDDNHVRLYILGTCMGAILLQRKILPLHGSAVVIDDNAYAIVGHSGAGKSTLASAFLKQGYPFLCDDIIPICYPDLNVAHVVPAYPQQKLWRKSLAHLEMNVSHLRPLVYREDKYAVPVDDEFTHEAVPLAGIFELVKSPSTHIQIQPIENLNKLSTLFDHTYRHMLLASMELLDWHFNSTAKIASNVAMYQLSRPDDRFTATDLVDVILGKIKRQEMLI